MILFIRERDRSSSTRYQGKPSVRRVRRDQKYLVMDSGRQLVIVPGEYQLGGSRYDQPAGGLLGLGTFVYHSQLEVVLLQTSQRSLLTVTYYLCHSIILATFPTGDQGAQHHVCLLQAPRYQSVKISFLLLEFLSDLGLSGVHLGKLFHLSLEFPQSKILKDKLCLQSVLSTALSNSGGMAESNHTAASPRQSLSDVVHSNIARGGEQHFLPPGNLLADDLHQGGRLPRTRGAVDDAKLVLTLRKFHGGSL